MFDHIFLQLFSAFGNLWVDHLISLCVSFWDGLLVILFVPFHIWTAHSQRVNWIFSFQKFWCFQQFRNENSCNSSCHIVIKMCCFQHFFMPFRILAFQFNISKSTLKCAPFFFSFFFHYDKILIYFIAFQLKYSLDMQFRIFLFFAFNIFLKFSQCYIQYISDSIPNLLRKRQQPQQQIGWNMIILKSFLMFISIHSFHFFVFFWFVFFTLKNNR
jgi:hypothetical protein